MNESERPNHTGSREGISAALQDLPESERTLLIVDDDAPLCQRLARAMERRGFVVATAESVAGGVAAASGRPPAFAVVDMRLGDGRGFDVVTALRKARPGSRIVMLTGYGNIATAVAGSRQGRSIICRSRPMRMLSNALYSPRKTGHRSRPQTRCRPIGCAGSTSSGSSNCATATSPRPPAGSRCTAVPCSASSRSMRQGAELQKLAQPYARLLNPKPTASQPAPAKIRSMPRKSPSM